MNDSQKGTNFYKITIGLLCATILLVTVPMPEIVKKIVYIIILITLMLNTYKFLLYVYHSFTIKEEKNNEELNKKYKEIKNSVISEKNTDILELMLANMREINDYYVLNKTQARNSFTLAVAMCSMGIVLMGVSIFAAFFYTSNAASAIIPAVGSAIVEVIACTSLFVYKKSLSQLNKYFNSLHSNERFLSIVNIVSKASPEVQDDMYFEIIKSQIGLVSTDLVENDNDENNV